MQKAKKKNQKKGLVIEGSDLTIILKYEEYYDKFIDIVKDCEAVVCCRSSPN